MLKKMLSELQPVKAMISVHILAVQLHYNYTVSCDILGIFSRILSNLYFVGYPYIFRYIYTPAYTKYIGGI